MIRRSQIPSGSNNWLEDSRRCFVFTMTNSVRSNEWIGESVWSSLFRSNWSPLTCKSSCWRHNWQFGPDWNLEALFP